jgi:hypothetical protein
MAAKSNPFRGDFNPPPMLHIKQVGDITELLAEISKRSLLGYSGVALFGNAFIQGGRLQFTSALPISQLMEMAYVHQAMKPSPEDAARGTVGHLATHANRPKIAAHSNRLRHYLLETACLGEKFFLPSFTLNFGAYVDRDIDVEAELIVVSFAAGGGGAVCFPAILFLPSRIRLPVTDGGHRYGQLDDLLTGKIPGEQKEALRRNSVDIKIVFEPDLADAHQDFADAGKAQPIAKSVIATYDLRDERNRIAKELSGSIPFLRTFVDATASSQNVSSKSPKVWAMSALRMLIDQIIRLYQDKLNKEAEALKQAGVPAAKTEADPQFVEKAVVGVREFLEALIAHVPTLRAIEAGRTNSGDHPETPATERDKGGGDVVLKAAFLAIAARAYFVAREEGIQLSTMAMALGTIPWQVLKGEKADLDAEIKDKPLDPYATVLARHLRPHLQPLVTVAEGRYRITPAVKDIDVAWANHLRPMIDAFLAAPPISAVG